MDDTIKIQKMKQKQQKDLEKMKQLQSLITRYKLLTKLGEGAYGLVYKAQNLNYSKQTANQQSTSTKTLENQQFVAIKIIKLCDEDEGIPATTLREISILVQLEHPNLVKLIDVSYSISKQLIFLVFDYIDTDFKDYINKMLPTLPMIEFKRTLYQLIKSLDFLHSRGILHRDLKPQNLLYCSTQKEIKLCDFGLSRFLTLPLEPYSLEVATLWYRPPELLFGKNLYSISVDMWAIGCIFAEMISKEVLFKGFSQIDMIFQIFEMIGTPNEQSWPGCSELPFWKFQPPVFKGNQLSKKFGLMVEPEGLHLLEKLLEICPEKRITAREALSHSYFAGLN